MTEMRPIPGFEGYYSITKDGKVWSHERTYNNTKVAGKWLKNHRNSKNCHQINLRANGKRTTISIEHMVHKLFQPDYGAKPKVEAMK